MRKVKTWQTLRNSKEKEGKKMLALRRVWVFDVLFSVYFIKLKKKKKKKKNVCVFGGGGSMKNSLLVYT